MTPFPIPTYVVACHSGQAARAEQDAYEAREAATLERGRRVLRSHDFATLAEMADDLYSVVMVLRDEGWQDWQRVDHDALEDTAAILRNATRRG